MICGSSSRGSFQTAKAPISSGRADDQRRQLGVDPGVGEASRRARVVGPRSRPDLHARAVRQARQAPATITFSPALSPESTSTAVARAPARSDQPRLRHAVLDHKDRLQLAALRQRAPPGPPVTLRAPSGKTARPNMPGAQFAAPPAGRSSRCRCAMPHPPRARSPTPAPQPRSVASSATSTACPTLTDASLRFFHRRFQPVRAFPLDGEQRRARRGQVARLHRSSP